MRKVAIVAVLLCAITAPASWFGDPVRAQWRYPAFGNTLESHDVVVGNGIELTPEIIINDDKFSIDLTSDEVIFRFNAASNWTNTSFNGWTSRMPSVRSTRSSATSSSRSARASAAWNRAISGLMRMRCGAISAA